MKNTRRISRKSSAPQRSAYGISPKRKKIKPSSIANLSITKDDTFDSIIDKARVQAKKEQKEILKDQQKNIRKKFSALKTIEKELTLSLGEKKSKILVNKLISQFIKEIENVADEVEGSVIRHSSGGNSLRTDYAPNIPSGSFIVSPYSNSGSWPGPSGLS
jgi:hypothetical protein